MSSRIIRFRWAVDIALALVFAGIGLLQLLIPNNDGTYGGVLPVNVALTLLISGALAFRRRWPIAAAAIPIGIALVTALFTAIATSFYGFGVPAAILVFGAARWGTRKGAVLVAILSVLLFVALAIHNPEYRGLSNQAFPLLMLGSAWLAGRFIRIQDLQRAALEAALRLVDEQQQELSRRAIQTERARIAREMHDVVAHGVSVMVVQAGAARVALPTGAEESRGSLLTVESSGRDVLDELRRVISLLRDDDHRGISPSPGLADLPWLARSMSAAGLDVKLEVADGVRTDPGRELALYRIVQEALTNTLRHAGPTKAGVRIETQDGALRLEVIDEGPEPGRAVAKRPGGGHGLLGLRERVAMYDGTFDAGPRGRGFAVQALLPLERR